MEMSQTQVYSWTTLVQKLSIDWQWQEAKKYLSDLEYLEGINLKRLWQILDQAWDETLEKTEGRLSLSDFLYEYYQHPVWLINAAFSESNVETISDRMAAVRLISQVKPYKILDFGGGIGTVARLCAMYIPQATGIDLVDITKFSNTTKQYLSGFSNIRILEMADPPYDAVICTEVLEHLTDPIASVVEINKLLRVGGSFAASWSFDPCINCHLPQNFHLKRLMLWIIRSLGFGFYGFERRGTTVYAFIKQSEVTSKMLKNAYLLGTLAKLPLPLDRLLFLIRGL